MRCQEVESVCDKNISSWISEVKQYQETMVNDQSQKGIGEYQIDEITYARINLCVNREEGWKIGDKIRTY